MDQQLSGNALGTIVGLHGTRVEVGSLSGIHIQVIWHSGSKGLPRRSPGTGLMPGRSLALSRACYPYRLIISLSNRSTVDGGRG